MARAKTELESYLVYGIDEKNRRIFFGSSLIYAEDDCDIGGFKQCSVQYALRAIHRMVDDHPKTPIEIHMDSYGGDPYTMLALYDLMQTASTQFKFYGRGAIMSAATWIMAGADERHLYPNTTVMVHNGWTGYAGKMTDHIIDVDEQVRLQEKLEEIYEENSRMPRNFWHEVCKRDLFLTAEETIFLGLADRVIQPKKRGSLRKIRENHLSQKVDKRRMNRLVDKLFKRIKVNTKLEIVMPEFKPEPVDERLTIESMPVQEQTDENSNKD